MTRRLSIIISILAITSVASGAHTGQAAGFAHPFTGIDHIAAMVAVGLLAARLGGRAVWAVPLAFVTMMVMGGVAGLSGLALPMVETGIVFSVVVLGLAALLRFAMPMPVAALLAGFFAIFHGLAHGAEIPADAQAMTYFSGFITATLALHGLGLGLGLLLASRRRIRAAA